VRSVSEQHRGYKQAEWVLIDYVDFVVHIFSGQRASITIWSGSGSRQETGPAELVAKAAQARRAKKQSGKELESAGKKTLTAKIAKERGGRKEKLTTLFCELRGSFAIFAVKIFFLRTQ